MINDIKKCCFFIFLMMILNCLFAQKKDDSTQKLVNIYTEKQKSMKITGNDIKLISEKDPSKGGYHLYVRKIPGINSILLTETAKDPSGKEDSYAYRAKEYNTINGDEIRYLDGKPLVSEGAKYSLVDSTPEKTSYFDEEAFHIYIPPTIVYGYEWSRNGEIKIGKGTFVNIRTFEKPYADYSGDYMDSSFMFNFIKRVVPKPAPEPEPLPEPKEEPELTGEYNEKAGERFKEISDNIVYSKGPETLIDDIKTLLEKTEDRNNLDIVFAIDATGSMKNDIEKLKQDLKPMLEDFFKNSPGARIGLLFYRDYGDNFNYNGLPVKLFGFAKDLDTLNKNLNSIKILGKEGGDVPEAVYEAIYASAEYFGWRDAATTNRRIILIGDAEPHPTPRKTRKYSRDYVMTIAETKSIRVDTILLPAD